MCTETIKNFRKFTQKFLIIPTREWACKEIMKNFWEFSKIFSDFSRAHTLIIPYEKLIVIFENSSGNFPRCNYRTTCRCVNGKKTTASSLRTPLVVKLRPGKIRLEFRYSRIWVIDSHSAQPFRPLTRRHWSGHRCGAVSCSRNSIHAGICCWWSVQGPTGAARDADRGGRAVFMYKYVLYYNHIWILICWHIYGIYNCYFMGCCRQCTYLVAIWKFGWYSHYSWENFWA